MNEIVSRSALLTVLVAAAGSQNPVARFQCYPIRAGDTAALIAQRLTGDAMNRRASWFEIVDQHWRVIPKAEYDVIQPGWHACLPEPWPQVPLDRTFVQPVVSAGVEERGSPASDQPSPIHTSYVWWFASFALAMLSVCLFGVSYWKQRQAIVHTMRRFGGEFVREFGRPLTQYRGAGRSPRSRLRIVAHRARLEILVAPSDGQSYPNLSDHKSNVEYDVARVMAALGNESFVRGRPYAEGEWVVLPFQFKDRVKQDGVR
jgi:hypothetical protein